jgi:hypothetical protein
MNDILLTATLMPDCLNQHQRATRALPARRISQRSQHEQERRLGWVIHPRV